MPTFEFVIDGELTTVVADGWRSDPDAEGWVTFWEKYRDPKTGATERPVSRYPVEDPKANIKTL